jgi:hypothetical protein
MIRFGSGAAARQRNGVRSLLTVLALFILAAGSLSYSLSALSNLIARDLQHSNSSPTRTIALPQPKPHGEVRVSQGVWHEQLRHGWFWGSNQGAPERSPSGSSTDRSLQNASTPNRGGIYRTVCVRLCDGYYWPISYGTTRQHFGRDDQACRASCSSPVKLFLHGKSEDAEDLVDLAGQPYTKLTSAFHFRTSYDANCKCGPLPWEEEAQTRHKLYALDAARRQGDVAAAEEFKALQAPTSVELPTAVSAKSPSANSRRVADTEADRPGNIMRLGSEPTNASPQAPAPAPTPSPRTGWQNEAFRKQ